ncbi:hypothetical protein CROQUDRAFT_88358 [Cronartium quercuum f. sp. fusiforme G11]|uniref:Uncharacterized protein n=1 Tax=Cronartium quercuum f. sp. fusiforme G11 TaxID=708437 RepID=A0A9P6TGS7_9BASI|nr:hypothetical protein CROQUDRAFT_88358 [Cronartium quercuum f. sp. fusiforme G11]
MRLLHIIEPHALLLVYYTLVHQAVSERGEQLITDHKVISGIEHTCSSPNEAQTHVLFNLESDVSPVSITRQKQDKNDPIFDQHANGLSKKSKEVKSLYNESRNDLDQNLKKTWWQRICHILYFPYKLAKTILDSAWRKFTWFKPRDEITIKDDKGVITDIQEAEEQVGKRILKSSKILRLKNGRPLLLSSKKIPPSRPVVELDLAKYRAEEIENQKKIFQGTTSSNRPSDKVIPVAWEQGVQNVKTSSGHKPMPIATNALPINLKFTKVQRPSSPTSVLDQNSHSYTAPETNTLWNNRPEYVGSALGIDELFGSFASRSPSPSRTQGSLNDQVGNSEILFSPEPHVSRKVHIPVFQRAPPKIHQPKPEIFNARPTPSGSLLVSGPRSETLEGTVDSLRVEPRMIPHEIDKPTYSSRNKFNSLKVYKAKAATWIKDCVHLLRFPSFKRLAKERLHKINSTKFVKGLQEFIKPKGKKVTLEKISSKGITSMDILPVEKNWKLVMSMMKIVYMNIAVSSQISKKMKEVRTVGGFGDLEFPIYILASRFVRKNVKVIEDGRFDRAHEGINHNSNSDSLEVLQGLHPHPSIEKFVKNYRDTTLRMIGEKTAIGSTISIDSHFGKSRLTSTRVRAYNNRGRNELSKPAFDTSVVRPRIIKKMEEKGLEQNLYIPERYKELHYTQDLIKHHHLETEIINQDYLRLPSDENKGLINVQVLTPHNIIKEIFKDYSNKIDLIEVHKIKKDQRNLLPKNKIIIHELTPQQKNIRETDELDHVINSASEKKNSDQENFLRSDLEQNPITVDDL